MKPQTPQDVPARGRIAALLIAGFISAGSILYGACATPSGIEPDGPVARTIDRMSGLRQLHKPAPPESEWNERRIWQRVGVNPPAYIPRGYSMSAPRTGSHGRWYEDVRDGKRLFVPHAGAGSMSEGVLRGEAIKATLWHDSRSVPGRQEQPLQGEFAS